MNIVLLSGSPSSPSRSGRLLEHVQHRLADTGARCSMLLLRDLPADALLQARTADPALQVALATVSAADIVVVATPIYKAAYSGLLKTFLDLLPQTGLRGKTVLPLATGGSLAHLLAVDYALRPVLHALGARLIADAVFVPDEQFPRDVDGRYEPSLAAVQRLDRALLSLFDELPDRRTAAPARPSELPLC